MRGDALFELMHQVLLGLVCFRLKVNEKNEHNQYIGCTQKAACHPQTIFLILIYLFLLHIPQGRGKTH